MKRLIYLLACFFPLLAGAADTGVKFDDEFSWQEIQEKAKAENRPIFMYFWSKGCGWCHGINRYVMPDPALGELINSHFIAVKVTDDQPQKFDTPYFHRWHEDGVKLRKQYGTTNPDFLFFAPDGQIVHRSGGYRNPGQLMMLVREALDPRAEMHSYSILRKYKESALEPKLIPRVVRAAWGHVREDQSMYELAQKLSKEYITVVLPKLTDEDLFADEDIRADNIKFAFFYSPGFEATQGSKGRFFQYAYRHPEEVDRVLHEKGAAVAAVKNIIAKEEVDTVLWNLGKPITAEPDWDGLHKKVAGKYDDAYARRLVLESQVDFYFRTQNWRKFAEARSRHIEAYPPNPFIHPAKDKLGVAADTLIDSASEVLAASDDPHVLESALHWLDKYQSVMSDRQEMEPRAKLLQKLGRTQEAIACQEKAIALTIADYQKDNRDPTVAVDTMNATLNKIKSGKPSWLPDT